MALKDLLKLHKHQPTRVVVELQDGNSRELRPDKDTRKRWMPILEPMAKLAWARVELCKGDVTLAVIDNPDVEAVEIPEGGADGNCPMCGRAFGGDDLDRMLRAQTVALTWQDKNVQTALNANVQTVTQLNAAIAGLTRVHQLQLEARDVAPAGAGADQEEDIVSILGPLARKLLGDGSIEGLTPERVTKLGAFLDTLPTPERKPPVKVTTPAPPAAKPNGANGAH